MLGRMSSGIKSFPLHQMFIKYALHAGHILGNWNTAQLERWSLFCEADTLAGEKHTELTAVSFFALVLSFTKTRCI